MEIVRNADGTLVVPVTPQRHHADSEEADTVADGEAAPKPDAPTTRGSIPAKAGTTKRWPSGMPSRIPIARPSSRR